MQVSIDVNEEYLNKAMDCAEQALCEEWFNGNKEEYKDWAGDRIGDLLWDFISALEAECGITIDTHPPELD